MNLEQILKYLELLVAHYNALITYIGDRAVLHDSPIAIRLQSIESEIDKYRDMVAKEHYSV